MGSVIAIVFWAIIMSFISTYAAKKTKELEGTVKLRVIQALLAVGVVALVAFAYFRIKSSLAPKISQARPAELHIVSNEVKPPSVSLPEKQTEKARIPAPFLGFWSEDCESKNVSDMRIDERKIAFYESDGPVISAVTEGKRKIALIAELTGEGETRLATMFFELSENQQRLTMDGNYVRTRCANRS